MKNLFRILRILILLIIILFNLGAVYAENPLENLGDDDKTNSWVLFVQSLTIIVREGFEAILIIGAIIAYLIKTEHKDKVSTVLWGSGLGVIASIITGIIIALFLNFDKHMQELLEGLTMLLATVVLFYVSYWLISKVEQHRWQQYIHGKVKDALTSGSAHALGLAAFLAVYREGFETVLFYQALMNFAQDPLMAVPIGFVIGLGVLGVIAFLLYKLEMRIPIKQFFIATSVILYYMAFVFMGKGIHELQEVGLLPETSLSFIPKIKLIGLYPTVETILAQSLFILAIIAALVYVFKIRTDKEVLASSS